MDNRLREEISILHNVSFVCLSLILSKIFIIWSISLIQQYFKQLYITPFFQYILLECYLSCDWAFLSILLSIFLLNNFISNIKLVLSSDFHKSIIWYCKPPCFRFPYSILDLTTTYFFAICIAPISGLNHDNSCSPGLFWLNNLWKQLHYFLVQTFFTMILWFLSSTFSQCLK